MKVWWTIGRKLMLACAASLLVTLALGYSCWLTVRRVGSSLQAVTEKIARQMDMAAEIRTAASEMRGAVRQTVISVALKDSGDYEKAKASFAAGAAQISRLLEDIVPVLPDEESRSQRDLIVRAMANWQSSYGEMIQLCEQNRIQEANEVRKVRQRPIADAIIRATTVLVDSAKARMSEASAEGERSLGVSRWIAGFLISLATLVGIAVLVVVRRNVLALQLLTGEVMQAADQVSGASAQVSSASQAIARGVTEQAASLEENSAASEEVDSVCTQGASRSQTAVSLMADAAVMVAEANAKLSRMTESMNRIGASSGQISKIIKVIDEIAFQTNILALNAAVEAARAGEAGAGFAVVADEVRNLAQRCAQAANDTGGLVQDSIATSGEACRNAEEVSQAINGLCDAATRAKTIIDEIHLGAQEQARGIGQITGGILQIQQATQSSAAAAEECAAAGEELSAQSESMRGIAWRLSAVVGAAGSW